MGFLSLAVVYLMSLIMPAAAAACARHRSSKLYSTYQHSMFASAGFVCAGIAGAPDPSFLFGLCHSMCVGVLKGMLVCVLNGRELCACVAMLAGKQH